MQDKLYVVVRKDLTTSQQAVQAGHALAEYLLRTPTSWTNGILVYLGVKDEEALQILSLKLTNKDLSHSCFCEPDLDDQITSIACLGTNKLLQRISLL